jgi:L-iditol 2-dehydrogenase/L-idonate 5-dehydrogenase
MNKAVRVHAAGDLRVEEVPEPTPEPHEAVVEIAYGGICGSDLGYWIKGAAGQSILKRPMILGHEVSGTVLRAAADGSGPAAGTNVTVHPATADSYLGSAAGDPHTDGAFVQRCALPASMLRPLPDGLSLRTAVLSEPLAVAWHGVRQAGDVRGRSAAVIGAGPIGSLAVAALRHHGASHIVATDLHEFPLNVARQVGADETLVSGDGELDAAADVVVESSGTVPGLASAIRAAKPGGTVVLLGLQRSGEIPALMSLAITRELTLTGSFRFRDEIDDVVRQLADGALDVTPVISHEVAMTDALAGCELARNSAVSSKVILNVQA